MFDVNATDDDKGIHGNLEYYITSGLNGGIDFTVDKSNGVVRVGASLDRETRSSYVLNITAKDKGITEQERLSRIIQVISQTNYGSSQAAQAIYFKYM